MWLFFIVKSIGTDIYIFCLFFSLTPVAYGGSQARGRIRAVSAGLHHSSQQRWILNPLSEARDWTCIPRYASQIHFCWATMGTPGAVLIFDSQLRKWNWLLLTWDSDILYQAMPLAMFSLFIFLMERIGENFQYKFPFSVLGDTLVLSLKRVTELIRNTLTTQALSLLFCMKWGNHSYLNTIVRGQISADHMFTHVHKGVPRTPTFI